MQRACVSRVVEVRGMILSRRSTLTRQCRFAAVAGGTVDGDVDEDAPGGLDGSDRRDDGGGDARHEFWFRDWGCARGGARADPRVSADFQGGHVGGHGSISSMCANHDRGFSSSDRPSPEARNSRRAERGRRFRASRFSHPPRGRRHSPPRVCASRRVLRDGEEGKKREEGQEGQEVRAPPPPAAPRAAPAARVEPPRSRLFSPTAAPDDDPPGFANPSQDAQEETVAQRALLLFFLLQHVFRYRGQRGCAPPPRLQDGTRTSVQRDPRTEIEARSILHRGRRAAREPVVDVADPSPPPASSSSTTARRSPLAGEEAGRASETGRDRRVHRRREPLRRRQLDGAASCGTRRSRRA